MEMAGPMTEKKGDYDIGYGKPPQGRRFKKGQSGNPSGRPAKNAKSAQPVLVRKSDEQILLVMNGRCQKTTRRDVVMVQLVEEPVAGFSATKFLADLLKEFETKSSPRSTDDHG